MKTSCAGAIRGLWDELNQGLFPWIDDNIGELDAAHRLFMAVCEAVIKPREFEYAKWKGNGRPPASRRRIAQKPCQPPHVTKDGAIAPPGSRQMTSRPQRTEVLKLPQRVLGPIADAGQGGGEGTRLPCARIHSRASFEKLQKRRQSCLQIKENTLWHYSTIDSPSPLKFNSNSS